MTVSLVEMCRKRVTAGQAALEQCVEPHCFESVEQARIADSSSSPWPFQIPHIRSGQCIPVPHLFLLTPTFLGNPPQLSSSASLLAFNILALLARLPAVACQSHLAPYLAPVSCLLLCFASIMLYFDLTCCVTLPLSLQQ